jgi:uncharacterized protein YndB with AHSA1/START domain
MAGSRFVYVTYIRTTPEKLWRALTEPEFTRQYWVGTHQESEWKKGASWKMIAPDGRLTDSGEIIEIEPYKRLVFSWRNEFLPAVKAEGFSRCTYDLEETSGVVKLTVRHEIDVENAHLIANVSTGWPYIFATLKSLLETGKAFEGSDKWPEGL